MRTFQMHLLEADKVFFEGECESLVVPTTVGQYGILAGHSNMISAVVPGVLSYRAPGKEWRTAAVSEGMVKVEGNDILVLVDSAEYPVSSLRRGLVIAWAGGSSSGGMW